MRSGLLPPAIWVLSLLKYELKSANQVLIVVSVCPSFLKALMAACVNLLREASPQKDNCIVMAGLLLVVVGVEPPQAARSSMVRPARPLSPSWHTCRLVYEILVMCLYLLIFRRSVANVPATGLANDKLR